MLHRRVIRISVCQPPAGVRNLPTTGPLRWSPRGQKPYFFGPLRATTNTRRERSLADTRTGAAVSGWDATPCCDGSDTCTSPLTAMSIDVRTPGARRASASQTTMARMRAKSRSNFTGPLPAPPTHTTSSPAASDDANSLI